MNLEFLQYVRWRPNHVPFSSNYPEDDLRQSGCQHTHRSHLTLLPAYQMMTNFHSNGKVLFQQTQRSCIPDNDNHEMNRTSNFRLHPMKTFGIPAQRRMTRSA